MQVSQCHDSRTNEKKKKKKNEEKLATDPNDEFGKLKKTFLSICIHLFNHVLGDYHSFNEWNIRPSVFCGVVHATRFEIKIDFCHVNRVRVFANLWKEKKSK